MELLLWRHAEAEDRWPDAERALTARGETQARRVAEWIQQRISGTFTLLCSPATRCQQTAGMLNPAFETEERLGVESNVTRVLLAAGWPENEVRAPIIVVGHQPVLGQTAAYLLSGRDAAWQIGKGGLWWFKSLPRKVAAPSDEHTPPLFPQAVLKAVISPEFA